MRRFFLSASCRAAVNAWSVSAMWADDKSRMMSSTPAALIFSVVAARASRSVPETARGHFFSLATAAYFSQLAAVAPWISGCLSLQLPSALSICAGSFDMRTIGRSSFWTAATVLANGSAWPLASATATMLARMWVPTRTNCSFPIASTRAARSASLRVSGTITPMPGGW